ncbi:MAG: hypothetical protein K2F65_03430, partial [Eubacterium sp.]|nr:hypothetical protein [Eubacterium sp.]
VISSVNVTAFAATTTATVSVTGTYKQTDARSMLNTINSFRTGKNAWYWNQNNKTKTTCKKLSKLKYSYDLEKVAMQRAAEVALSFSHTRPDGTAFSTAYTKKNYTTGENIAYGYSSAASVFKAWEEANEKYAGQGHRRNMLHSKYNTVGIAHIVVNGVDYWVQEFSADKTVGKTTAASNKLATVKVNVGSNYKPQAPKKKSSSLNYAKITVNWNAVCGASGYQAECSTDKNFKSKKTVTTNSKTLTASFSGLKANTKYYIRLRTYMTLNGKKVYSNWSAIYNSTTSKAPATTTKPATTIKPATTTTKPAKTTNSTTSTAMATPAINVTMVSNNQITFYWKELTGITGYQAQLATNSSFSNAKQTTIKDDRKAVFSGLKSKTTYYVRVRSYKTTNGKTTYSAWSTAKAISTK